MGEINQAVIEAAEWLDDMAGQVPEIPADWRDNIDPSRLDMASASRCILGQLFGSYSAGLNALRPLDPDGLDRHEARAFDKYTDDWKVATRYHRVSEKIRWAVKGGSKSLKGARNVVIGDKRLVAVLDPFDVPVLYFMDDFIRYYRPFIQVEFKRGDVLKSKQSGRYFLYLSDEHVICFENMTRHSLRYWVDQACIKFELDNTKTGDALWGDLFKGKQSV